MQVFIPKISFDANEERYFRVVGDVLLKDSKGKFAPHVAVVEQFDDGQGGVTENGQRSYLSLAKLPDELSGHVMPDAIIRVCTWPKSSMGFIEMDILDSADAHDDDLPFDDSDLEN